MTDRRRSPRRAEDRMQREVAVLMLVYVTTVTVTLAISGAYGQLASVIDSLFGIGLVIAIRNRLHAIWGRDRAYDRLAGLILLGALGAFAVNLHHPQVAVASVVAFTAANGAASLSWTALESPACSAVTFALVDSFVFPPIAFGTFTWWVLAGQLAAKLAGALAYGWLLSRLGGRVRPG